MEDPKAQLIDKLKTANNVLVTVSRDPSVDQLSALLGLTLLLNKEGKHAAAVFSGQVPSTIEFLKPEETIEKNTDSLRDFIIALDKSKADKLRYKVEDNVVRIFITPYRTSISQDDLEFSQGDFNVDVVVGLGVNRQEDLDEAIITHGRILHDATVASINIAAEGGLGSISWHDPQASSLSELVTEVARSYGDDALDEQIATALLTGIVAETERFSNAKTSSHTMQASAALMAAGANQQLVAEKLDAPAVDTTDEAPIDVATDDSAPKDGGTLEIDHEALELEDEQPLSELPPVQEAADEPAESDGDAIPNTVTEISNENLTSGSGLVTEPPTLGGTLTANTQPEGLDPSTDPLSMTLPASEAPMLNRDNGPATLPQSPAAAAEPVVPEVQPAAAPSAPVANEPAASDLQPPAGPPAAEVLTPVEPVTPDPTFVDNPAGAEEHPTPETTSTETLAELEAEVQSAHQSAPPSDPSVDLDAARSEVDKALFNSPDPAPPVPIQALNAQPLGDNLHSAQPDAGAVDSAPPIAPPVPTFVPENYSEPTPPAAPAPSSPDANTSGPTVTDSTSPPPVPPPIPFQFGGPSNQSPPL